MHRQAREWIITMEVMKLERRQRLERELGKYAERPRPRDRRRTIRPQ